VLDILLQTIREEYTVARDRLLNGLYKLNETNSLVDGMKAELAQLQPVLEAKSKATAELLVQVTKDQKEAEEVKKNVSVEEKEVKIMAEGIQVGIKELCRAHCLLVPYLWDDIAYVLAIEVALMPFCRRELTMMVVVVLWLQVV
jgi:hypothetical protein